MIAAAAEREGELVSSAATDLIFPAGVMGGLANLLGLSMNDEVLAFTGVELYIKLVFPVNVRSNFGVSTLCCSATLGVTLVVATGGLLNGPEPRPASGLLLLIPLRFETLKLVLGVWKRGVRILLLGVENRPAGVEVCCGEAVC